MHLLRQSLPRTPPTMLQCGAPHAASLPRSLTVRIGSRVPTARRTVVVQAGMLEGMLKKAMGKAGDTVLVPWLT